VAVLIVAYQILAAETWTLSTLAAFVKSWLNFDLVYQQTYALSFSGSAEHSRAVLLRLGYMMAVMLLAAPAFLAAIRSRLNGRHSIEEVGWISGSIAPALLTSYGGEIVSRSFNSGMPAIFLLIAAPRRKTLAIVAAFLLVAPLVSLTVAYGNMQSDWVEPSEISSSAFAQAYAANSTLCSFRLRLWFMYGVETKKWEQLPSSGDLSACRKLGFLVVDSARDLADYEYLKGPVNTTNMSLQLSTMNRIYDVGKLALYGGS